jgi:hypothetical protein
VVTIEYYYILPSLLKPNQLLLQVLLLLLHYYLLTYQDNHRSSVRHMCCSSTRNMLLDCILCWAIILLYLPRQCKAGNNNNNNYDTSVYGLSMQRDWLYQSGSINLKYEGCVWGYVNDRENMGCMQDSSEDGTTYWYMMANCRRAQVAYSLYASSSAGGTKCKNSNFKESVSVPLAGLCVCVFVCVCIFLYCV